MIGKIISVLEYNILGWNDQWMDGFLHQLKQFIIENTFNSY